MIRVRGKLAADGAVGRGKLALTATGEGYSTATALEVKWSAEGGRLRRSWPSARGGLVG